MVKPETKIGLIGHFKDDSSYYLRLFPEWEMFELDSLNGSISATPMREAYFRGEIREKVFPNGTISPIWPSVAHISFAELNASTIDS